MSESQGREGADDPFELGIDTGSGRNTDRSIPPPGGSRRPPFGGSDDVDPPGRPSRQGADAAALNADDAKRIVAASSTLWLVLITAVWRFDAHFQMDAEAMRALAASSVDLGALGLAAVGVLHALGWHDRVFRALLLVVGLTFVATALCAFLIAFTLGDAKIDDSLSVWVVVLVGAITVLQMDWLFPRIWSPVIRFGKSRRVTSNEEVPIFSASMRVLLPRIRLVVVCALPLLLPVTTSGSNVSLVVVLFLAGISNLAVLSFLSTMRHLISNSKSDDQTSGLEADKAALEDLVIQELRSIQNLTHADLLDRGIYSRNLIDINVLEITMRSSRSTLSRRKIDEIIDNLEYDGKVFSKDGEIWLTPTQDDYENFLSFFLKIPIIVTYRERIKDPILHDDRPGFTPRQSWHRMSYVGDDKFVINGLSFSELIDHLVRIQHPQVPRKILQGYFMPVLVRYLLQNSQYAIHNAPVGSLTAFVRKDWIPSSDFTMRWSRKMPRNEAIDLVRNEGLLYALTAGEDLNDLHRLLLYAIEKTLANDPVSRVTEIVS